MNGETFVLLLRLGLSLSLVFGLMWVAGRVVRGKAITRRRTKVDHLEIVERKALTKNSSIAIVRVGGETLTVGITDANVTLLGHAEIPLDAIELPADAVDITTDASGASAPSTPLDLTALTPATATTAAADGRRRTPLDALRDMTVRHIAG